MPTREQTTDLNTGPGTDDSSDGARVTGVRRTVTLIALSLTFGLVQFDATVVNVALNAVRSDLGGGIEAAQWLVDGYAVPFAACMLAAGAFGDRLGHRAATVTGFAVFGVSSLFAALATGWAVLIPARVFQGVGAAIMLPASLALIGRLYPVRRERARALGIWGGIATAGFAAGPVIGGLLISAVGWPAIFWLNLPVAAVVATVISVLAPRGGRSEGRPDLVGTTLAVVALGALTAGIIESVDRPPLGISLIGCTVVAGALFVITQRRSDHPLVDRSLLGRPEFGWALVTGLVFNFGIYGSLLCVSLALQSAYGFSALRAGLGVLPSALVVAVGATSSGFLVARLGARKPMVSGFCFAIVGMVIIAVGAATGRATVIILGLAVCGLLSLAMPAMTSVALNAAPSTSAGLASGSLNTTRQLGGAIGVAVLGAMLNGGGYRTGFVTAVLFAAAISAFGVVSSMRATRHRLEDGS
ncbi:MFS transporter [Microlunatus sp. Gsoil 973]|uniref:MFS transporter n=1 Tax=Microlunatus sp. Gsoil 973 TaxID=2672569 RepID=UPI0018A80C58|nr:MFS transporter [Microlunatus sp. Gsoil 973]